jgi:hypothetical protein
VHSEFMMKTSKKYGDDNLPGLATIDTSAWIQ